MRGDVAGVIREGEVSVRRAGAKRQGAVLEKRERVLSVAWVCACDTQNKGCTWRGQNSGETQKGGGEAEAWRVSRQRGKKTEKHVLVADVRVGPI